MAVVAGCIAATLAFAELFFALPRTTALTFRATHWVLLRIGVDFILGVLAYPLILAASSGKSGHHAAWVTVLAAGAGGTAVLRTQLSVARREGRQVRLGVSGAYDQLRSYVDRQIVSISAAVQSDWIVDAVVPALKGLGLDEIRQRSMVYVEDGSRAPRQVTASTAFFESTITGGLSEDEKRLRLAQHLLDLDGRPMVKSLMKAGRRGA
jgi:hypothetical protein